MNHEATAKAIVFQYGASDRDLIAAVASALAEASKAAYVRGLERAMELLLPKYLYKDVQVLEIIKAEIEKVEKATNLSTKREICQPEENLSTNETSRTKAGK